MSEKVGHRSSDAWEAAALYACGWPIVDTESEEGLVFFCFPRGGDDLTEAVQGHRAGRLMVSSLAIRQAYYEVRARITKELRGAGRS